MADGLKGKEGCGIRRIPLRYVGLYTNNGL